MTKNVGNVDRAGRIALAVIVGALYATGMVGGVLGLILGAVSVVLVLTALVSFCPLYKIIGLSTCSKCQEKPEEEA